MIKTFTLATILLLLSIFCEAQYVNIPDTCFRNFLQLKYPACFNTARQLDTTCTEILTEDSLVFAYDGRLDCFNIKSIVGIQYFTGLKVLSLASEMAQLDSLVNLPESITFLDWRGGPGYLKYIDKLPSSLVYFNCSDNLLTSLPPLPKSLQYLNCSKNSFLKDLPPLPDSLISLDVSSCGQMHFPLPPLENLKELNCFYTSMFSGAVTLPKNLVRLDCRNQLYGIGRITSFTSLPKSLRYLAFGVGIDSWGNYMDTFPELHEGLDTLICSYNSFTSLPSLPQSLKYLDCFYNKIVQLPALPDSLTYLNCGANKLDSLPNLPDRLSVLDCYFNNITQLPVLPASLKKLECSYNKLTNLPELPATLERLYCQKNSLTDLPNLPGTLTKLDCSSNKLYCLPKLPNTLIQLTIGNSINCLPNKPNELPFLNLADVNSQIYEIDISTATFPICTPVNNSNHCQSSSVIEGAAFADINSNGVKDTNEFYLPNLKVTSSNGTNVYTDKNGRYQIQISDTGHCVISVQSAYSYFIANPAVANHYITSNDTFIISDFAMQPIATIDSMQIKLHAVNWAARPGFPYCYLMSYQNVGTTTVTPTITFNYDQSLFTYDSSSNHSMVNNGTGLILSESSMLPGEQKSCYIYLKVKTSAPLSSSFVNHTTVAATNVSVTDSAYGIVRGSFDPNDKQATPSLTPKQVASGTFIDYTIRFQNTGTDTAFNVVVTDTLSNLLQENTLELINVSHPCNITRNGRALTFEFLNILLPDSNVNEPGSHGYINFRVKPQSSLVLNSSIKNKAFIYFDYNLPVITNTATTVVQNVSTVPVSLMNFYGTLLPNNHVELSWITANEINIQRYVVQRSVDAVNYTNVTELTAKGRNTNVYSYNLLEGDAEVVYYRLMIADANGKYSFSKVVTIKRSAVKKGILISSNVRGGKLDINTLDASLINTQARILNANGVVVKTILLKQGVQQIDINNLSSGNYYIQTILSTDKIIIIR